jgi:hypothetical protein
MNVELTSVLIGIGLVCSYYFGKGFVKGWIKGRRAIK